MSRFFYSRSNEATADVKQQPEAVENRGPKLESEILSTGNQVVQSPQLTDRIHDWRNSLIHDYNSVVAEWSNLKSAVNNEIDSAEKYICQNVLTDSKEINQMIVPSTILSLGAFFCGRVLTNRDNWGHRSVINKNISVVGRIFTSLPMRIVFPFLLTGAVFDQITPGIERNAWNTIERDFLPDSFVNESYRLWDQWYIQGIKRNSAEISETIHTKLQGHIKTIRESINDLNSNSDETH